MSISAPSIILGKLGEKKLKEIERTIGHEGVYSDDPRDIGNWTGVRAGVGILKGTKYGISAKAFPELDIKSLTKDAAVDLHMGRYWKPMKIDLLHSTRVRFKVYDIGFNCGPGTAIRLLQEAVGAKEDGLMGEETANLANAMNEADLLIALMRLQIKRYVDIVKKNSSQLVFLSGWIKRAFDTGEGL